MLSVIDIGFYEVLYLKLAEVVSFRCSGEVQPQVKILYPLSFIKSVCHLGYSPLRCKPRGPCLIRHAGFVDVEIWAVGGNSMRLSADIPVIAFLRTPTVGGDAIMT